MRFLAKSLAALLLAAAVVLPLGVAGLLALAWYCSDEAPAVARAAATPAEAARARQLAARSDPRRAPPGVLRTITLTQEDLDLLLPHLAAHAAKGQARAELQPGRARLRLSLPLPSNPFGPWLNVQAQLVQAGDLPQVQDMRLGRLALPQPVADWLLARGLGWLQRQPGAEALDSIAQVQITPDALRIAYAWNDGAPAALKAAQAGPEETARLRVYQEHLQAAAAQAAAPGQPLPALLQPLLELAGRRAAGNAAARAAEQRAALLALAFHVNGKGLAAIVPALADAPAPLPRNVHLAGRSDLAQHFAVSAALAAVAGTPLADAVGPYKAQEDAGQDGGGFSFADLAADRAGARFGALAVAADQGRLQQRLAAGLTEQDLLPPLRDLPEFLPQAVFERRYGEVGSPAFKRMRGNIDRRIGVLALYR
ncbi:hypothetical protein [Pseudorhodoferax sp.]|uniref:hypothetical protein n=1 Tax=Pseudorhodoferax sp. TaxID=1993553 RepID=UPI0039E411EE